MSHNDTDDAKAIAKALGAIRERDCREAFTALEAAFASLADALAEALEQPGVRAALAKSVRAAVAQLREEATLARLRSDPSTSDNFLQTLAKAELTRRAMRLEERAAELEQTAGALERQARPGGDSPGFEA